VECYESRPERAEQVAIGRECDPTEDSTLDQVFTAEYGPDGKTRPVTVREVLYGDGSGKPPMGILATTPKDQMEPKNPFGHNRAARRAHARQARKRARK
jgi:hypothetical protein